MGGWVGCRVGERIYGWVHGTEGKCAWAGERVGARAGWGEGLRDPSKMQVLQAIKPLILKAVRDPTSAQQLQQ